VQKVSVTVITRNEAANLPRALESVAWADEIIVVDCGSDDETVAVARRHTDHVVVREWRGYSTQKNYAASLARYDWILSIDADERVTPELAREIGELLEQEPPARGYRIPRRTWYLGRWIRSTDWYPDRQLRLYDRRAGRWGARRVHESVEVDGPVGTLGEELLHYPYPSLSDHLQRIDRYTSLAALELNDRGVRAGAMDLLARPPVAFLRNFLLRRGVRDGTVGLIISLANSYYVLLKFAKLWELQHVLSAHRHGAELAGRPEPGAPDGSGASGDRASRRAGRAS
jgi:glycosyltransferase involved in cell wall biosynthesis